MTNYKFDCGCEVKQLGDTIKEEDGLPPLNIDFYNLPDCPMAWQLFQDGKTQGIWQLEKSLGQNWSKKLKPVSIEEVAALGALLRPGCLKAIMDGKSMTQHYVDRKHGIEESVPLHSSLDGLLDDTHNVLTYQEQSMAIAAKLAAFDLQKADNLRKAIGKKKADVMAKAKEQFIEGCKTAGIVNDEDAAMIFSAIEKSNRYAFNRSHAVEYGMISYWTGWAKSHFPMHFFCSYLNFAKEKIKPKEEIEALVDDSRQFDIPIFPPKIDSKMFSISKNGIYFGLNNVKGLGESKLDKVFTLVNTVKEFLQKDVKNWTWFETLTLLLSNLPSDAVNNLIAVGVFGNTGLTRQHMLMDYNIWRKLTERERGIIFEAKPTTLIESLNLVKDKVNVGRKGKIGDFIKTIESPPFSLEDNIKWVVETEANVLGTPLTFSKLDACKLTGGDATCKQFVDGRSGDMTLAVEIIRSTEYAVKNGVNKGQKMGYLTLRDGTGKVEAVVFSNIWTHLQDLCYHGNTVLITGYRDKNKDSLVVKKAKQL